MKIATTIELDTDQLIAVGLMETGKMVPAKASQVRTFVETLAMSSIAVATGIVTEQREIAATEIKTRLGLV